MFNSAIFPLGHARGYRCTLRCQTRATPIPFLPPARFALDGDGDHDDAEKGGGINLHQLWDPETLVDEPTRWEITLYLRDDCPYPTLTTDLTPRRCQKFKAAPGQAFKWTNRSDDKEVQSGTVAADQHGLITIKTVKVTKGKNRLRVSAQ